MRISGLIGISVLGLATSAVSASTISVFDRDGDALASTVAPGGTFQVVVAVTTDVPTTGVGFLLEGSEAGVFTITGREILATAPYDTLISSNPVLLTPANALLNPKNNADVGIFAADNIDRSSGTYELYMLSFMLSPSASGTYTLRASDVAFTNSGFDTLPAADSAVYTVAVPEPTALLGVTGLAGLVLGRRRTR